MEFGKLHVANNGFHYDARLRYFAQVGNDVSIKLPIFNYCFFHRGISSRMACAMWWFFSLLMTSSYTANLAAYLAKERMGPQINNLDDLLSQNRIKFGTMMNGSTYQFFKTATYPKHQAVWSKMNSFKPSTYVDNNKEGVRKVLNKNQDYAFFMESASMEYEINKHCELKQIGGLLDSKGYAIAMPIGNLCFFETQTLNRMFQMRHTEMKSMTSFCNFKKPVTCRR